MAVVVPLVSIGIVLSSLRGILSADAHINCCLSLALDVVCVQCHRFFLMVCFVQQIQDLGTNELIITIDNQQYLPLVAVAMHSLVYIGHVTDPLLVLYQSDPFFGILVALYLF